MSAANYSPPQPASGINVDQAAIAAMIQHAVANAVASQQQAAAEAARPKELSPEERARAALDKVLQAPAGAEGHGLGVEERLLELYRIVELLAQKAGI